MSSLGQPVIDPVGLCASCVHMGTTISERGSKFYLCQLSFKDTRFPKYPRLPVVACSGYKETAKDKK